MEPGRLCIKIKGRDNNSLCVILEKKGNKLEVLCLKRKKKRLINPSHLYYLNKKIEIENKSDEEIIKELTNIKNEILR